MSKYRFADVAVTPQAKEFQGIYRNKQYHEPDFEAVLDRAAEAGVQKVMLTGMRLSDVDILADIVRSRPGMCSMTVGCHPYHATEPLGQGQEQGQEDYLMTMTRKIKELQMQDTRIVSAFGELGLDYDNLHHASRDAQTSTFKAQLDICVAEDLDLPLFLHCRAAFDDFVAIIAPYTPHLKRGGLVHSFVGSTAQMQHLVSMGLHISVNGYSFATSDSTEMVRRLPLDRLQIETDAPWGEIKASSELAKRYPYVAATSHVSKKRDKFEQGCMVKDRNESCNIGQVASIVAGLKEIDLEVVVEAAWNNSINMFRL